MDEFVERAAASPLPVLLRGEFGTEKMELAAALHSGGPPAGPVCRSELCSPAGRSQRLVRARTGRTLYFHEVDELPVPLQGQLSHRMRGLPAAQATRWRPARYG